MFLCRTASEQGGHIGLMTFTTGGQIEAITWNTSQGFSTALSALYCPELRRRTNRTGTESLAHHPMDDGNLRNFLHAAVCLYGNEVFSIFVPRTGSLRSRRCISAYRRIFAAVYDARNRDAGECSTASGVPMPPAIVSIVCNYMRMPCHPVCTDGHGSKGIWWAVCVTTIAKGLILLGWFTMIRKNA